MIFWMLSNRDILYKYDKERLNSQTSCKQRDALRTTTKCWIKRARPSTWGVSVSGGSTVNHNFCLFCPLYLAKKTAIIIHFVWSYFYNCWLNMTSSVPVMYETKSCYSHALVHTLEPAWCSSSTNLCISRQKERITLATAHSINELEVKLAQIS